MFLITRGDLSSWSLDQGSAVDVDGLLYAPGTDIAVQASAALRPASAIVRSVIATGAARVELNGEIEQLETDPVPGRARLVR